MYRVVCCPMVYHVEFASHALLTFEKRWDRQTDRRTDKYTDARPTHCAYRWTQPVE